MALPGYYSCDTEVLQGFTRVLNVCYRDIQMCQSGVKGMLQGCYKGFTGVLVAV